MMGKRPRAARFPANPVGWPVEVVLNGSRFAFFADEPVDELDSLSLNADHTTEALDCQINMAAK
jgi:hypothetical protein